LAEESIRESRTTPEGCFEVIEINAWQAPRIHLDDISKEGCELIIACRGQPHGFVLVARGIKAEGRGHRAEYHSQRVWEFGLVMKPQLSSGARHKCGRPHIADVAGCNDRRSIETRGIERRGGMRHLVVHVDEAAPGTKPLLRKNPGSHSLPEV